jgi:hypothetical protein
MRVCVCVYVCVAGGGGGVGVWYVCECVRASRRWKRKGMSRAVRVGDGSPAWRKGGRRRRGKKRAAA